LTGITRARAPGPDVQAVFDSYPQNTRAPLLEMRRLIFDTAAETAGVGAIDETLKWGQPAYLTTETGAGSTIRTSATGPESEFDFAVHFICHTTLVATFRQMFPGTFTFDKNRSILFRADQVVPRDELRECIAMALTYHL